MLKYFFVTLLVIGFIYGNRHVAYDADLQPALRAVNQTISAIRTLPIFSDVSIKDSLRIIDVIADEYFPPPPLPEVDEMQWWEGKEQQDNRIRPYTIRFEPKRIHRLIEKLSNRENFTEPLHNANFSYGINSLFLNHVLDYWQTKYDFKSREKRLNSYPQFQTNIQGLDIHFYHIKPKTRMKVVPLLMLHGWPLSNMEYLYLFPELLKEREGHDHVFEIVAPSIPGFGYSEGTSKKGLKPYQIAIMLKNLMNRLGYKYFYIHGGDFGQYIAADMMTLYQDEVLGLHTNFPYSFRPKTLVKYLVGSLYPPAVVKPKYENRLYPVLKYAYYVLRNFGYFHMHASKPDTIGIALEDSPSGLASWILTAMSWSSNPNFDNYKNGGLPDTFNIDDLLDVLTIMWDAQSVTTSIRLYAEISAVFQDPKSLAVLINPTKSAYACIKFRYEIIYQPDSFLKDKYKNLVHSKTVDFGGHFAAFENPDVLVNDIWQGVGKMKEFNRKRHKERHARNGLQTSETKDRRILPEVQHNGYHIEGNVEHIFEANIRDIISAYQKSFGSEKKIGREELADDDEVLVDDDLILNDEYRFLKMNMHG